MIRIDQADFREEKDKIYISPKMELNWKTYYPKVKSIKAVKMEQDFNLFRKSGAFYGFKGDYLIKKDDGLFILQEEYFNNYYELIEDQIGE